MLIRFQLTLLLLSSLIAGLVSAAEKQLTLSAYLDSNPLESVSDPAATPGLKIQERWGFKGNIKTWDYDGFIVGQGFVEPLLLLDSKAVGNALLSLRRQVAPRLLLQSNLSTFQKLYFSEMQHSSRSTLGLSLEHYGPGDRLQKMGMEVIHGRVNTDHNYAYLDRRASLLLRQNLASGLMLEGSIMGGLASFRDLPARNIVAGVISSSDEDQLDNWGLLTLHLRHSGSSIWGISLSRQMIRSNSVLSESSIWLAKLYLSRRLGVKNFMHLVVQGMDKNYAQNLYPGTTPTRDPEETIQNQVHLQLERVLTPHKVVYLQVSYSRNETIYNYWFYEKNLIECGIKLTR